MAFGGRKRFLGFGPPDCSSLYPRHPSLLTLKLQNGRMAELQKGKALSTSLSAILPFCNPAISRSFIRQHPRELRRIHLGDGRRAAEAALALGRLAAQDVLLEGAPAQELSVLGPLEALRCAAVRFQFRHSSTLR